MTTQPAAPPARTHVDIHDGAARAALAGRLGVSEERLRKAVRIVGNRVSTLESHFRT